jgi:hypothetical protein
VGATTDYEGECGGWALVLDASEGLGEALAADLAQRGINVAIAASPGGGQRGRKECFGRVRRGGPAHRGRRGGSGHIQFMSSLLFYRF